MSRTDHARPPRQVREHQVVLIKRRRTLPHAFLRGQIRQSVEWQAHCTCRWRSEWLESKRAAQTARRIHLNPGVDEGREDA